MNEAGQDACSDHIRSLVEDMKNRGMGLFEGYIPEADGQLILPLLVSLSEASTTWSCANSLFADGAPAPGKTLSLPGFVDHLHDGRIVCLNFDYDRDIDGAVFSFRLLIEKEDAGVSVEMLCYRDCIVEASDPVAAVKRALGEFHGIYDGLSGNALFFGPDSLEYPESPQDYPPHWFKLHER
jgi:hypothetical protein